MSIEQRIVKSWYTDQPWLKLLAPLSWLYSRLATSRRDKQIGQQIKFSVPVIVVGNISVGGTGKTPLIIALARALQSKGYRPGVISRGYGGKAVYPLLVQADTSPQQCGDEPKLINLQTGCPVVVDPDRNSAVSHLLQNSDCDLILSDDGLQHYRLHRDMELVVVDGERGFGNGKLLPQGPLRELPDRLNSVDFVIANGDWAKPSLDNIQLHSMLLSPEIPVKLDDWFYQRTTLRALEKNIAVNAVAGIGNPQRFQQTLQKMGYKPTLYPFSDHHQFTPDNLKFDNANPIIMTAKDAVKCGQFAELLTRDDLWVVDVEAQLADDFYRPFLSRIAQFKKG